MKKVVSSFFVILVLLLPACVFAGFTETLPKGTFLLDMGYIISNLDSAYNNEGEKVPLIEPIDRYEPGGGMQGVLIPEAEVELQILLTQIHYGITESLTLGIAIPLVTKTYIQPNMRWEPGDYQNTLGRPYSETDFWQWADSMGQPKPDDWEGNKGVLSDIILAGRYRFTDKSEWFQDKGMAMSFMLQYALPTGTQPDPEEVITAGTTTWDLHSNGELNLHLGIDKTFKESLDNRLVLGLDLYHEFHFPHRYTAPTGEKNPLMLNFRPYVGKHYTIDGGDFSGFSTAVDVVPLKGPALATWVSKNDSKKAESFPPLLTLSAMYTYTYLQQSDWESESEIWDWEREKLWRPGYKNILTFKAVISLLRVGAPIQPYVSFRNLTWIPGKNCRAPDVWNFGARVLMQFW